MEESLLAMLCAVPVLPATRMPGMRAAAPVPPSLTTPVSAWRRKAQTAGDRSTCPVILLDDV